MAAVARNKTGLCLSGGGFRASLFHIGTLAALAEAGKLHEVEVLSTVSGGSIIGACYYLKLREFLQGERPGYPFNSTNIAATRQVYIDIVAEIERDFLAGVQQNPRVRILLSPGDTARLMTDKCFSRCDRIAKLYDGLFYIPIVRKSIYLHELQITPSGFSNYMQGKLFDAQAYNDNETFKIPILTINATSLNTGHPFHFTGAWVGEPLREQEREDEQNSNVVMPQLRFDGYYQDDMALPVDQRRRTSDAQHQKLLGMKLSYAVAASSAVPGIFPPLSIHGLYQNSHGEEIVMQVCDGGVFDNQGVDALHTAECSQIIISDATGQLEDQRILRNDTFAVLGRSNSVMMERIRNWNYADCSKVKMPPPATPRASAIFMHLRQISQNSAQFPALPGPVNMSGGIVYRLASLRTDLDSFTDTEAYALMYHAYCLTHDKLTAPRQIQHAWNFLQIIPMITKDSVRLEARLKNGSKLFFKPFYVIRWRRFPALVFPLAMVVGLAALGWYIWHDWDTVKTWWQTWLTSRPLAGISGTQLFFALLILLLAIVPMSDTLREAITNSNWFRNNPLMPALRAVTQFAVWVLAFIAAVVCWLHLNIFNPIFIRSGRISDMDKKS